MKTNWNTSVALATIAGLTDALPRQQRAARLARDPGTRIAPAVNPVGGPREASQVAHRVR